MAESEILFEYQVAQEDGAIVIRVGGSLISDDVGRLSTRTASGAISLASLMSPLSTIGRLLSPAAGLAGRSPQIPAGPASPAVPATRPDWLNQELAQSFEDFQRQVQEFRAALEEIRGGGDDDAGEAVEVDGKGKGRKRTGGR